VSELNVNIITESCYNLMAMVDLSKNERGSISLDGKAKSLQQRWFGMKKSMTVSSDGNDEGGIDSCECVRYLERNSLISLKCKRGRFESIEMYRVLGLFTKYYNKWFIATEEKIVWDKRSKQVKVLARMVKRQGAAYEEVKLEENGNLGPKSIFCMKLMSEILSVDESVLKEY
jgi:hypothetical protein